MSKAKSAYEQLGRDDQRFVDEYIKTLDASGSYRTVHPNVTKKSSYTASHHLLKKSKMIPLAIAERVAERNVRVEVDQDLVLREVLSAAMMDPIDLFNDDGTLKDLSEIPSYIRRCISGIEIEALYEGKGKDRKLIGHTHKLKLVSKDKMLDLLARHTGLIVNKHEFSGPGGRPIEVNTTMTAMMQMLDVEDLKLLRTMKEAIDVKTRDQQVEGKGHLQLVQSPGGNGDGSK